MTKRVYDQCCEVVNLPYETHTGNRMVPALWVMRVLRRYFNG